MDDELSHFLRPREMRDRHGRASKGNPDARRDKRARRLIRAQAAPQLNKLIERGLNGDRCGGDLAWMVASVAEQVVSSTRCSAARSTRSIAAIRRC